MQLTFHLSNTHACRTPTVLLPSLLRFKSLSNSVTHSPIPHSVLSYSKLPRGPFLHYCSSPPLRWMESPDLRTTLPFILYNTLSLQRNNLMPESAEHRVTAPPVRSLPDTTGRPIHLGDIVFSLSPGPFQLKTPGTVTCFIQGGWVVVDFVRTELDNRTAILNSKDLYLFVPPPRLSTDFCGRTINHFGHVCVLTKNDYYLHTGFVVWYTPRRVKVFFPLKDTVPNIGVFKPESLLICGDEEYLLPGCCEICLNYSIASYHLWNFIWGNRNCTEE